MISSIAMATCLQVKSAFINHSPKIFKGDTVNCRELDRTLQLIPKLSACQYDPDLNELQIVLSVVKDKYCEEN
jgi:hypothetical protein